MPRGKSTTRPGKKDDVNAKRKYWCASDAPWLGFVNLKVSENERSDFDGWSQAEGENIWPMLEEQMVEGLKLSVSYDAENGCSVATFTGAGCVGIRERCCFTARAATWDEAVRLLLYKHLILMDGDWSSYLPKTGRRQTFG